MTKKPKSADAAGLTDDEIAALQQHYTTKIRLAEAEAEKARAAYKAATKSVNALFKLVKADLDYTRIEFEEVLDAQDMDETEFLAKEARRHRIMALQGLPVGAQIELPFGDTVDDAIAAEANGYKAGRRGEECSPPDAIHPSMHPQWSAGWHRGQETTINLLNAAPEALDKLARARGAMHGATVDEEQPAEEADDDLDPDTIASRARALRDSDWMEPSEEAQRIESEAA